MVISGLVIVWTMQCLSQTNYIRVDKNIWVSLWLGYYYWRNLHLQCDASNAANVKEKIWNHRGSAARLTD
jgi:hypothetical protein